MIKYRRSADSRWISPDAGIALGEAELVCASAAREDGQGCTHLSWLTERLFVTAVSLGLCVKCHMIRQGPPGKVEGVFNTLSCFVA